MKKKIPIRKKSARITLRLDQDIKDKWVAICKEKNNAINDFITSSVEGKLMFCERREIMKAIEERSNELHKIGININQIAKFCNTVHEFPNGQLEKYNQLQKDLNSLFLVHNDCLKKIYHQLARI